MRRKRFGRGVAFVVCAALAVVVFGEVVMHLWNWLAPPIFGWRSIGFAQALGLLFLSRILFGRVGGHRGGGNWRWRKSLADRYDQMTPAEREKFRQGMNRGCEAQV
jgi:hypothetical protein